MIESIFGGSYFLVKFPLFLRIVLAVIVSLVVDSQLNPIKDEWIVVRPNKPKTHQTERRWRQKLMKNSKLTGNLPVRFAFSRPRSAFVLFFCFFWRWGRGHFGWKFSPFCSFSNGCSRASTLSLDVSLILLVLLLSDRSRGRINRFLMVKCVSLGFTEFYRVFLGFTGFS